MNHTKPIDPGTPRVHAEHRTVGNSIDVHINPGAARLLERLDAEFEAARLDSADAERDLLSVEGGCLSTAEFAKDLGVSINEVRRLRAKGHILAWTNPQRPYQHPAWQIYRGRILHGLSETLSILRAKGLTPHGVISFFVFPSDELGGKSPVQLLRAKHVDDVLQHARRIGDIGS